MIFPFVIKIFSLTVNNQHDFYWQQSYYSRLISRYDTCPLRPPPVRHVHSLIHHAQAYIPVRQVNNINNLLSVTSIHHQARHTQVRHVYILDILVYFLAHKAFCSTEILPRILCLALLDQQVSITLILTKKETNNCNKTMCISTIRQQTGVADILRNVK